MAKRPEKIDVRKFEALMFAKGVSVPKLALLSGVPSRTVQRALHGEKVSMASIIGFALALDTTPEEIAKKEALK